MVARLPGDQMHTLMQKFIEDGIRRRGGGRSNVDEIHDMEDNDIDDDNEEEEEDDEQHFSSSNSSNQHGSDNDDDDDDMNMDGDSQNSGSSAMFDLMASFVRNLPKQNRKPQPLFKNRKRSRSFDHSDDEDDDAKGSSSSEAEEEGANGYQANHKRQSTRQKRSRQSKRTKRTHKGADDDDDDDEEEEEAEEEQENKNNNDNSEPSKKPIEDVDGVAGTGIACEQLVLDDTNESRRRKRIQQAMLSMNHPHQSPFVKSKHTSSSPGSGHRPPPSSPSSLASRTNPSSDQHKHHHHHPDQHTLSGQAMTSRKFKILDAKSLPPSSTSSERKHQDERHSPSAPGLGLAAASSSSSSSSGRQNHFSGSASSSPHSTRPPDSLQSHSFMCRCESCISKLPLDLQQTMRPNYRPIGNFYAPPSLQQPQQQQNPGMSNQRHPMGSPAALQTEPFAVPLFDERWMGAVSPRDFMPCIICHKIKPGPPNSDSSKEHKDEIELRELLALVAFTPFEILCPVIQMFLRARYDKDMTLRGIYQHFLCHARDEHVEQNFYARANFEISRVLTDTGLCVYDPRSGKILVNSIGIRNFLHIQRASQNLNDSKRTAGHRRG